MPVSAERSAAEVARRRRYFVVLPVAALILAAIVILASAYLRHTQAGLACTDWPACYGRIGVEVPDAVPAGGVHPARIAHRLAATGALALVIGQLLIAWTQRPAWTRDGVLAVTALVVAVVLALAALGIATPPARLPAVALGNLLGGYLLLAILAAGVTAAIDALRAPPAAEGRAAALRWLAVGGLALVFVQAALGGMIGAQFAMTACPTLGSCVGFAPAELGSTEALDAFRPLVVVEGRVVPPEGAAVPVILHRILGPIVAAVVLALAYVLRRMRRVGAVVLTTLALAAPLLGAATILALPSLPLTVAHNAVTAALIGTLAWVAAARSAQSGSG
jgi:cytochrome c oxidase assembly protein subunit 15